MTTLTRDQMTARLQERRDDYAAEFHAGEMTLAELATQMAEVERLEARVLAVVPPTSRPAPAFRKARIVARVDAMTVIAEVSKRTALHSPRGFLNRNATPDQVAHIARCNRTLDRCHRTLVKLSLV
jgi:hypothetical protein